MEYSDPNESLEDLDADFLAIRSLLLSGSIKSMYKLVTLSPTKIARLLGLNYASYHSKLVNPEKFTEFHINILAYAIHIDPNVIHNVIQHQIQLKVIERVEKFRK
ncbi:hypothetical protein [Pedobacter sp. Leaf250]|uniref:hypothetical protein n=1 Tax=Pedobacter sp. Leaf250 TaxID=2876559 RepID=UPI001E63E576|nr:hypothetical protein [Pedobacter sp. Leaf250]